MKKILFLFSFFSIQILLSQSFQIDTLKVKETLIISKIKLTPEQLKLKNNIKKEISLHIFHEQEKGKIPDLINYKPKPYEIAFFYMINQSEKNIQMIFIFGKKIKKYYHKDDFNKLLEIVKLLEHQIFSVNKFSGMKAYSALEQALSD